MRYIRYFEKGNRVCGFLKIFIICNEYKKLDFCYVNGSEVVDIC